MEYQELSHGETRIMQIWAKPQIIEKMDNLAKFCRMTRGQLLEQILDGVDDQITNKISVCGEI